MTGEGMTTEQICAHVSFAPWVRWYIRVGVILGKLGIVRLDTKRMARFITNHGMRVRLASKATQDDIG